jgi:putative membrane protein
MLAEMAMLAADHPGWNGTGPWHDGGPGWWLAFPIAFWVIVVAAIGYLVYRRSPRRSARAAAEHTLADRFARGEISAEELEQRRNVLRGKR